MTLPDPSPEDDPDEDKVSGLLYLAIFLIIIAMCILVGEKCSAATLEGTHLSQIEIEAT